ncbi:hypothetical protein ACFQ1S_19875, partial [Kibdelosporangium lantanae]
MSDIHEILMVVHTGRHANRRTAELVAEQFLKAGVQVRALDVEADDFSEGLPIVSADDNATTLSPNA